MKNMKGFTISVLAVTLIIVGVAYAAFSQNLTVNGTGTISSTWGPIYISSCSCASTTAKDSAHPSSATCTPTTEGTTTDTTGTITATMISPGDKVTCTFNTVNAGTLHAAVPTFSVSPTSNDYFTVTGGSGTCIKAKSGTTNGTGSFTVSVEYKSGVTAKPASQTITVTPNYKQAASCA